MLKVAKFGGSSLADSNQFIKVKKIIESDESRKVVVVSACGKRFDDDNKVTDLLYLCHAHLKYGVSYEPIFSLIEERYYSIKKNLKLNCDLDSEFKEIRSKMKKGMNVDYLVSRGEYLCALLMSEYLGYTFVDAKDLFLFNFNGSLNEEKSKLAFNQLIENNSKIVVPGFYGSLPNQDIKVMSRGGSDISGALLADMSEASVYENWSDVSGILVADPRIIQNPSSIETITYSELRELSYMGANVLHDEAIFPVKNRNIPINIRNTNDPTHPGTMILNDCSEQDKRKKPLQITGISGKKDFTSITIYKHGISNEYGIAKKALQVFENYKISIDNCPIGIDSFSIIVATEKIQSCLYELLNELKETLQPDDLKVADDLAMVATVGRGMVNFPGMSGKLFNELGLNHINIRTISQGSDELNIMVGVETKDFERTIQVIYNKFITGGKQ